MKRPENIPFTTTVTEREFLYIKTLEKYCDFLEGKYSLVPEELKPIMCSIHKDKLATWRSKHREDLFYCSKCSDYVAEEYGIHRIERLEKQ